MVARWFPLASADKDCSSPPPASPTILRRCLVGGAEYGVFHALPWAAGSALGGVPWQWAVTVVATPLLALLALLGGESLRSRGCQRVTMPILLEVLWVGVNVSYLALLGCIAVTPAALALALRPQPSAWPRTDATYLIVNALAVALAPGVAVAVGALWHQWWPLPIMAHGLYRSVRALCDANRAGVGLW